MSREQTLFAHSRAGCMVSGKMTPRRVADVLRLRRDTIGLSLSLTMGEQSLEKKMGCSSASRASRVAKKAVVRLAVRKGILMRNMEERLVASGQPVS